MLLFNFLQPYNEYSVTPTTGQGRTPLPPPVAASGLIGAFLATFATFYPPFPLH